jgi:hypothetical protein
MPKHPKKSDHLQLLDSPKTTLVEVPLPLLGAFTNIENSFFDLCVDAGQQVLGAMMEQDREELCGPGGSATPIDVQGALGRRRAKSRWGGVASRLDVRESAAKRARRSSCRASSLLRTEIHSIAMP